MRLRKESEMNKTGKITVAVVGLGCIVSPAWADGLEALVLAPHLSWLPGTLFGVLVGLWGALAGVLAPRGRAKGFLMVFASVLGLAMVIMLVLGIALLVTGHPFWVWYAWLLPGAIGIFVLPPVVRVIALRYAEAEARKLEAMDVS